MQIETILIPVGQLTKSPFNQRKKRDEATIKELAASVWSHGLIHNLVVHEINNGRKASKKTLYGVADGERRRSAFELLVADKRIPTSFKVPCRLITVEEAADLSLAANVQREPMHPADELVGFRMLQEAGKSAEEIAARYGVTPLVVKRRLKLANVAPQFFEMFRADDLSLDQMMALAQTEDHDRQIAVWDALPHYQRTAHGLRHALTSDEVNASEDRIACYVGVKAYETAGGVVRRDLFSDDENAGYMQDASLLHQLAQAKLERKQRDIVKEGWSWTETRITFDHSDRSEFGRVPTVRRDATEEEQTRLSAITARLDELPAAANSAEDGQDLTDEEHDESWDLEEQREELEKSLREPDPNAKSYAGAVITIGPKGQAEVLRGLIRPEDRKRIEREQRQANAATMMTAEGDTASEPPQEKEFSERLTLDLTSHFTAALRLHVARAPSVALAAIVYPLVMHIFGRGKSWESYVVCVSHTSPRLDTDAPGIDDEKTLRACQAIHEQWRVRIPDTDVLPWLLSQSLNDLLELLAFCTASAIDCRNGAALSADAKTLARAVNLDMSQWWQPTAASFLGRVSKPEIVKAVHEAGKSEEAKALTGLKKAQAVSAAEDLLRGSQWIPSVLRV